MLPPSGGWHSSARGSVISPRRSLASSWGRSTGEPGSQLGRGGCVARAALGLHPSVRAAPLRFECGPDLVPKASTVLQPSNVRVPKAPEDLPDLRLPKVEGEAGPGLGVSKGWGQPRPQSWPFVPWAARTPAPSALLHRPPPRLSHHPRHTLSPMTRSPQPEEHTPPSCHPRSARAGPARRTAWPGRPPTSCRSRRRCRLRPRPAGRGRGWEVGAGSPRGWPCVPGPCATPPGLAPRPTMPAA